MNGIDELTVIFYRALVIGILYQGTEVGLIDLCCFVITINHFNSYRNGSCDNHVFRLREDVSVYKKFWAADLVLVFVQQIKEHGHRFGGGGRLIEQRRVGQWKPREIADDRL